MLHPIALSFLTLCAACGGPASPAPAPIEQADRGQDPQDEAQKELERVTEEVRADVEELRGERFNAPVKVAISDAEEFRSYVRRRLDATTTPAELAAEEEVAKLLGLLPPDYDYLEKTIELVESQVGGFYDPGSKAFFLMEGIGDGVARFILAHELVHALDDQLFGLDQVLAAARGSLDAEWAVSAVAEGSGTAIGQIWLEQNQASVDFGALAELMSEGAEELEQAPTFLWKPLLGVYVQGQAFLAQRPPDLELSAAIRRAFVDPPRSSEQVLHPERYWDPELRDDPRSVRFEHESLPEGWELRGEDTWGELGLGLFVEPPGERGAAGQDQPSFTSPATAGWDGDRWLLLARGDTDRVLVLATAWDSEADAREFAEAARALRPHVLAGTAQELTVTGEGSRVQLVLTRGAGRELAEAARGWARFE